MKTSRNTWFLAAALLIAGLAALPLFTQTGLLNTRGGGDSPFLLQRLHQLVIALSDGHFPVRWMPDANYGYGYPFYNYYAPLSIYGAAAFRFFGFEYIPAIKLAQLAGFLIGAWAMFELGRRWFHSAWAGLLAAAAYTLAPFHLVNIYVRGDSLAEFWTMAFYPVVVLFLDYLYVNLFPGRPGKYSTKPSTDDSEDRPQYNVRKRRAVALLALAFAALVLSHNISALIFTPFVLIYILILWIFGTDRIQPSLTALILPLFALIVALALSAWFWVPALGERSLAQLEPVTSGYFHYSNHFRSGDLIQLSMLFNYDVSGGNAFRVGLVQVILAVIGLAVILISKIRQIGEDQKDNLNPGVSIHKIIFIIGGFILATVMILPLSRPLWDNFPLLPFVQFPWRFLSIFAFFAALGTSGLALLPGRRIVVPLAILLLLVSALGDLKTEFLSLTDADITAERLAQYEWFTGNIGSTVSAEYLPQSVRPRPYTSAWLNQGRRDRLQQLEGDLSSSEIVDWKTSRQRWQINAQTPGAKITFPTINWPVWNAEANGQDAGLGSTTGSGLLESSLPSVENMVDLGLKRTPVRWAGELVSLAALFIIIWLIWPESSAFQSYFQRSWRAYLVLFAILLGAFLILRLWPDKSLSVSNLTWDFSQMAYLHHDEDGVPFDNGMRLGSYEYSAEEVRAGELLEISILWDEPEEAEATLALATPAVNRFKLAPLLVSETQSIVGDRSSFKLEIPENAPTGLYVPRLKIPGAHPLTPTGQLRGDLFLRPVRILDHHQPAVGEGPSLDARALRVVARGPKTLDVQLQWKTMADLTQNYNFSLRLADKKGIEVARFDNQPGYGYQPSSLWPTNVWVNDWLAFPLPENLPRNPAKMPFALVARLYDVETGEVSLVRRLGELNWRGDELEFQPSVSIFSLPADISNSEVNFNESTGEPIIGLRGYKVEQEGDEFDLTLYWQALVSATEDYYHFVHLIDPESGEILAQHDSQPRSGNYPTSQWTAGEIVSDAVQLDLIEVPAGRYELFVGLYRRDGIEISRLSAVDPDGFLLPRDSFLLPQSIVVE